MIYESLPKRGGAHLVLDPGLPASDCGLWDRLMVLDLAGASFFLTQARVEMGVLELFTDFV